MPRYRVTWTETDFLETFIDADSENEAIRKFDDREYEKSLVYSTEFQDGPFAEQC